MQRHKKSFNRESGMALITSVILLMLLSSLLVGFMVLVMTGQQLSGSAKDETRAFYGAEAGLEKLTADLGTLFDATYAPSASELAALTQNPPASIQNLSYTAPDGSSGYVLTYPGQPGAPIATNAQVKSGPYAGMHGLITPYTLTVTARTSTGAEVMLRRTTQTVGIPAFQFGIFSDKDLGFHAGPDFNFGGRVHTNGNLFLAEGTGATLTLSDKVTVYGEVVRDHIMNGQTIEFGSWTGTVNAICTGASGCSGYRSLAETEGSVNGMPPGTTDTNWPTISKTYYNSNIINHLTGVQQALQLPIVLLTKGQLVPAQPIDIIRRPLKGEAGNPALLGERYFSQASIKVLLSDNSTDLMQLPCIDASTQPVDLSTLAIDKTAPVNYYPTDGGSGTDSTTRLPTWYVTGNANPIPLATSAGGAGITAKTRFTDPVPAVGYATGNGYWIPKYDPLITGFIKIEVQIGYNPPCGKWQDVTQDVLKLGFAGRNLNPGLSITSTTQFPNQPPLPSGQISPSSCADPNPNAVIRIERVRDNPSNYVQNGICSVNNSKTPPVSISSQDYWPNALFDTREAIPRDTAPANGKLTLGGGMNYIELDAKNLARYLTGQIGTKGAGAFDATNAPYDYVIYFSDRRGNFVAANSLMSIWPPTSPSGNETGEYGFNDYVNPSDAANGCPNGGLDAGEDIDENAVLFTYGMKPTASVTGRFYGDALTTALVASSCSTVTSIWPGYYFNNAQDARMNPTMFFRRALKVVNGNNLYTPLTAVPCPGSTSGTTVPCGLTIVSENPVYLQGDFNANSASGGFNDAHVGASIIADAVTLLSNNFNDINTFSNPYNLGNRNGTTTWYRVAVLAGKHPGFPWITNASNDMGSDGGVHNFLRYIENWGGQTLNYRGSIVSLFWNRQAVGVYKCCNTVYSPPTRGYNFDTDFLTPSLLPPRTPMFRDVNTTGFAQILYPDQK